MHRIVVLKVLLTLTALLSACGTTRKLSQVEQRSIASEGDGVAISDLRTRVMQLERFPQGCPREVSLLPNLAGERIQFAPCPQALVENFQLAIRYLKMEERSILEEAIGSQCRSLGKSRFGNSLETLLAGYESTGPSGRRAGLQSLQSMETEAKILDGLRKGLEELIHRNLPLDRWIEANGEFVVPEYELSQLERLVANSCRLSSQQIHESTQMTRALEELTRVLQEGEQRERIQKFLDGVHRIVDERIEEFFYPR